MVNITADRPYTLHINSAHRSSGDSISEYTIAVEVNCENEDKLYATLLSARIPATVLQLSKPEDRIVSVSVADDIASSVDGYRTVKAVLDPGNYTSTTFQTALQTAINTAFTTANTTFAFSTPMTNLNADDTGDSGLTAQPSTGTSHAVKPVFEVLYSASRSAYTVLRTDAGGLIRFGSFRIAATGERLRRAIGMSTTSLESYHFRTVTDTTTLEGMQYKGEFKVIARTATVTSGYGHTAASNIAITMHHDDAVYLHCDLGTDAIKTSVGGQGRTGEQGVLAVIPQYGNAYDNSFYAPSVPVPMSTNNTNVTALHFRLQDSSNRNLDFRGVDHTLEIQFSVEAKSGADRSMANLSSMGRTNSGYNSSTAYNRFPVT